MDRKLLKAKVSRLVVPRRYSQTNPMKIPFIARKVRKWLFDGDDLICLTRDNVIPVNREVQGQDNIVLPSQVVDHFIEKSCYRFIMHKCICRDATGCKDYPMDLGCLFLGESAKEIHPELGREATVEESLEHAKKCREAGLVHIVGKSKLDTVWLEISKGEKLFTICSCCPCCCISRGIPYYHPIFRENFYRMPGVTVSVTEDCQACGTCLQNVCMYHAISMGDEGAVIDGEKCMGCGRCVSVCPNQAIEVTVEDDGFVKDTIARLAGELDVT